MKKYLFALFLLLPTLAQAQIIGTLPVTLTNGTLADANQVMSDFNAIVTGVNTNGAKNGANSDITALNALTTPITPAQGGSSVYTGSGTGTGNAQLVVAPTPLNFALTSGNTVIFIPGATNTGPATLAVAGTAAKNILRQTSTGLQPLTGGEVLINQQSVVIYDGTQFELINSAVTANVQPCTEINYQGISTPTGYLAEDGAAVSRTTFATLFSCLSNTTVSATTTSGNPSVAVANSATYQVGWYVGGTNVTCNSTILSKADGTHITISNNAGGNGATTLTIGPFPQGDCSSTFNVPNMLGRDSAGVDTAGSTLSAVACPNPGTIGSKCGSTTQTILAANLPPYTPAGSIVSTSTPLVSGTPAIAGTNGSNGGAGQAVVGGTVTNLVVNTLSTFTGTAAPGQVSTPFLLQPVGLVTKAIKF